MNSDADPVQMTKISSMNLFHSIVCGLPNSFNISSNFPINRLVPFLYPLIAVPWICRQYLLLNSNTLSFRTTENFVVEIFS